jgi:hypothetical protein
LISKVTLFSFLLMLLLAMGIRLWTLEHVDPCAAYLSGDKTALPWQMMAMDKRAVPVPCSVWWARQPQGIQILCLLDIALAAVFLMNALGDLRDMLTRRRRLQQGV